MESPLPLPHDKSKALWGPDHRPPGQGVEKQLRMWKGKGKQKVVKGQGPLQGVRPDWQEGVSGESTWCIVPRVAAQDSLRTGGQQGQGRACQPSSAPTRSCHVCGAHGAHTLCTHTLIALPRFHFLEHPDYPGANSDNILILLLGTSFHAPCHLQQPGSACPPLLHLVPHIWSLSPPWPAPHQDMLTPHPN